MTWLAAVLPVFCLGDYGAQQSTGTPQQALDAAMARWGAFESGLAQRLEKVHSVNYSVRMMQTYMDVRRAEDVTFKRNLTSQLLLKSEIQPDKREIETLLCKNAGYSFILTREAPSGWAMTHVDNSTARSLPEPNDTLLRSSLKAPLGAVYLDGFRLVDVFKRPYLRVLRAQTIETDSGSRLQIQFDSTHQVENTTGKVDWVQEGTVILDPSNDYCLVSANYSIAAEGVRGRVTIENKYELEKSIGAVLLVSQRETKKVVVNEQTNNESELNWTWEYNPESPPSDQEFMLSNYGLEEPFGSPFQPPTPWFLYAGVGAGAIFLLVVLLGVWQKRLARSAA